MDMKTISMLELRQNALSLVKGLERGEGFALSYRNRVVGHIQPVLRDVTVGEGDPVFSLADSAEDLGESLSAAEADRLLYGE